MPVFDEEVEWRKDMKFDADMQKIIERNYPEAEVAVVSDCYYGTMGGQANEYKATWEGTWNGEFLRVNFSSKEKA